MTVKTKLGNSKYVVSIVLDLKRVFESVNRDISLCELNQYCFYGTVSECFENYLTNHKQKVRFNNATSSELLNNSWVPQGSVVGSLFFILYLNDREVSIQCNFINIFADYTLIPYSEVSLEKRYPKNEPIT